MSNERVAECIAAIQSWEKTARGLSDEQIIERCKAAGIKWIPPEPAGDCDSDLGFTGSFDMASMDEMRTLLGAKEESEAAPTLNLSPMLTPFGMLVRALRIVAGTTLYDMAKALLTTPANLSSMEFGRAAVPPGFAFDVAAYFDALGITGTLDALNFAAAKGDGHE